MSFLKNILSKIHTFTEKKVMTIWLVSYIVVFLIPIIISSIVSSTALNIVFEQSELLANEIIARKQDDFNSLWTECETIYQNVCMRDEIQDMLLKTNVESITPLNAYNVKNSLLSIPITNNAISDIQVVFNHIGIIGSRNRVQTLKDFIDVEENNSLYSDEILSQRYTGELKTTGSNIAYLKTINYTGTPATLVIIIQPTFMNNGYENIYNNEGVFFILDKNNNLILSDKETEQAFLDATVSSTDSQNQFVYNGETYLRYINEDLNIKHFYVIPYKAITTNIKPLTFLVVTANLLTVLLGIFSIHYFLKRNIRPINEIMQLVGGKEGNNKNEFSVIMNNIKEKNEDAWAMTHKLNAFKPLVIQNVLEQLLVNGNLDTDVAEKLDIHFNNPLIYILLIDIENLGDFETLESENDFDDARELSFVAVSNIFSEILSPLGNTYCGVVDDTVAIILNAEDADLESVKQHSENAYMLCRKYLGISGRIILSTAVDNVKNLPSAYQKGINQLEYSKIMEETGVITGYSSVPLSDISQNERTELFISQILSGDKNAALATINTVLKENLLSQSHVSKYNLANMLMMALGRLTENDKTILEQALQYDNVLKVIMTAQKISDVRKTVESFVVELCDICAQGELDNESIEEQVCLFIKENFAETEINVKIVADMFRMTPSYLSAKFKQKYGMSILEYINQVRIEHAKHLFRTTELSIESVYKRCGYVSKATFLRQFKKSCGMTPTEFRDA